MSRALYDYRNWIVGGLFLGLLRAVVDYAWVTDDAFITFRVVRNLVAGDGPVFNLGERVQVYTHPLWFALLSIGEGLGAPAYFWSVMLGLASSTVMLGILCRNALASSNPLLVAILLFGVLRPSETFRSFQTSGLEGALTSLLIVLLITLVGQRRDARDLCLVALVSSALMLNRLDQLPLVAPLMLYALFVNPEPWWARLRATFIGGFPFVAWKAFSLAYYGFIFPNSKYAKVDARSTSDSIASGWTYLLDFAYFESLPFALMVALIFWGVIRRTRADGRLRCIGLGIVLQLNFIIYLGGDFMRGRFLHGVMIAACAAIPLVFDRRHGIDASRWGGIPIMVSVVALYLIGRHSLAIAHPPIEPGSLIHNERDYYKEFLALQWEEPDRYRRHPWAIDAQTMNDFGGAAPTAYLGVNGQRSFYVRSEIDLIDPLGVTDPFIARCPAIDTERSGHFEHAIPSEYLHERLTGERFDGWSEPELELLWRDLERVTSSDRLFSRERFAAMWRIWSAHGI